LNKTLITILSVLVLPMMMFGPATHAVENLTDHLLLKPYEGSAIRHKNVQKFDEYSAFFGMDQTGEQPVELELKGKITKLIYSNPKERSIFEIFQNYHMALEQGGAKILYQCNQKKYECAKRYAGPTFQKLSDIHSITNLVGRYLLAKIENAGHTAVIAVAIGEQFTDIHIIEITQMDKGMVTLDANALGSGLDADGYVIVHGIYFDTDKASIQTKSKTALVQVVELLSSRPEMNIYIVGHSDMQGSFKHNIELSKKRANSVLEELATQYGITRSRMDAQGLGPLAPEASNKDEQGRSMNRRVVIVVR
jgi:OOP family OmpA-OmpF porin